MKKRNVSILSGGGGPLLTGTIDESKAFNCHCELRERVEAQSVVFAWCLGSFAQFGMTPTESVLQLDPIKNAAFTMAEILLSLTIIGVVAAITLPSLTGNINERTWNTQRKALYARFSQAIALMPALNGYGTLTEGDSSTSAVDTAAETFVTNGLAKVLKINNICDSEHLDDCGIPSKITALNGSIAFSSFPETLGSYNDMFNGSFYDVPHSSMYSYSQTDTKVAAFETANGESIAVYYNPRCQAEIRTANSSEGVYMQSRMCANFVYDLNGTKGPNTVGKDIGFISVLYPSDSMVVAPVPLINSVGSGNQRQAGALCLNADSESRLPNKEEAAALFYNRTILGLQAANPIWTGSLYDSSRAWHQSYKTGLSFINDRDYVQPQVFCVKR